jgi:hypothetical protein
MHRGTTDHPRDRNSSPSDSNRVADLVQQIGRSYSPNFGDEVRDELASGRASIQAVEGKDEFAQLPRGGVLSHPFLIGLVNSFVRCVTGFSRIDGKF